MNWPRAERTLIVLIALHSVAVGLGLTLLAEWGARFGGFGEVHPTFFARQAGVFHFVVAFGYLYEYFRYRSIGLLLFAKSVAVVFLALAFVLGQRAWLVPLSAAGDATMGALAWWVHARATAETAGS
ncbi:MAG: hypothetical protein MUF27_11345 [Acidobacteria bacterium]|nr:hypothetical protein [Acidobacteriota bacterium]